MGREVAEPSLSIQEVHGPSANYAMSAGKENKKRIVNTKRRAGSDTFEDGLREKNIINKGKWKRGAREKCMSKKPSTISFLKKRVLNNAEPKDGEVVGSRKCENEGERKD